MQMDRRHATLIRAPNEPFIAMVSGTVITEHVYYALLVFAVTS